MFFFSITIFFPFPVLFIYFLNILAIGSNNFLFVPFEINFFFGSHGFLFALRGYSFCKGSVVTIFLFFLLNQLFLTGPHGEELWYKCEFFVFGTAGFKTPTWLPHRYSPSSFSRRCRVTPIFSSAFYLFIIIYAALLFATRFPVNASPCSVFTECCLSSLSSSFCFHHHLPFLPSLSFFSSSLCCHYPVPLSFSLIIKKLVSCPLFLFYSLVYISNVLSIFPSILLFSFSPPLSISTFPSLFAFLLVIPPFFPSLLLLSQSLLFSSILFCFLFCV